jgi:hypothetical protein
MFLEGTRSGKAAGGSAALLLMLYVIRAIKIRDYFIRRGRIKPGE